MPVSSSIRARDPPHEPLAALSDATSTDHATGALAALAVPPHPTAHDHEVDPLGEGVRRLEGGRVPHSGGVEQHEIGYGTLADDPTIPECEPRCRQRGHLPDRGPQPQGPLAAHAG